MARSQITVAEFGEEVAASLPERLAEQAVPGAALGIVGESGDPWLIAIGSTRRQGGRLVTPHTIFGLQSISKTYTATLVMLAVKEGRLELDEPITTYLPDFHVHSRFEARPERRMALRHLLSHTAGFTHEAPMGMNYSVGRGSFEDHVRSISDTWLRHPVGQRFEYSNLGIDLAAFVLQTVRGRPFSQLAKEDLFRPLEMGRTTFDVETIRRSSNRAAGHSSITERVPVKVPMMAAGGLYTSVSDGCRFVRFHLLRGRELGLDTVIDEMYRVPFPVRGQIGGYALGIVRTSLNGTTILGHGGGGFGFLSDMYWCPEAGIGTVLLTNSDNHQLQRKVVFEVLGRVCAAGRRTARSPDPTAEVSEADLRRLEGTYIGRGDVLRLELREGRLGVVRENSFHALSFLSPTEALMEHGGEGAHAVHFVFDGPSRQPAYIVSTLDGSTWSYNDGPNDLPGEEQSAWNRYVGHYAIKALGVEVGSGIVTRRNGYLYLDWEAAGDPIASFKLVEYRPGLFFTSTGEAVDFNRRPPTFANIPLRKRRSKRTD